ncbi:MAG: hypothetical protein EPO22_12640 [Dehalococcoidia bacterium]|nr:MAG: hypothetical protein EPO22_12640 [Dehalococcoidia bacterium]
MLSTFVDTATDPRLLAFVAVGLIGSVLIAVWPALKKFADNPSHHLRQLPKHALTVVREPAADAASPSATPPLPRAVFAFGAIGVVLAAWTGYAFTRPAYQKTTVQGTRWENATSFTFTGHGPASNALPDGTIGPVSTESIAKAGSPPALYSNVLSSLDFAFKYQMRSERKLEVLGTGGAALRIKAQDGWERTLMLQPAQPLIGSDVTLWFTVNLDAARLVIAGVEKETGSRSEWYDFSVVPVVRLVGQQGAQHIDETYAPEYHMRYDRVHITPDATMERTEPITGPVQEESSRQVQFFGLSLSYALARWLAGVAAIAALARAVMLVPSKPSKPVVAPKAKAAPAPAAIKAVPAAKAAPAAEPTSATKPVRPAAESAPPAPAPPSPPAIAEAPPPAVAVEPAEPTAADVPPTAPPAAAPPPVAPAPAAQVPAEPRPSPETLRAAIQRNLAASAEMAALLADSVKAASNGGGHHNNGHSIDGESPADESPAA